jgi:hypothetical protein
MMKVLPFLFIRDSFLIYPLSITQKSPAFHVH